MTNITKVQNEILNDPNIIESSENSVVTIPSYDKEISRLRDLSLNDPNEHWREIYKKREEDFVLAKEWIITSSEKIIKSAIKATSKEIIYCYPSLLTLKGERRYFQLRTKIRPFDEEAIEELGKRVKSITCVCKDGVERTYWIKKIKAFYGVGKKRKGKVNQCVNVYF